MKRPPISAPHLSDFELQAEVHLHAIGGSEFLGQAHDFQRCPFCSRSPDHAQYVAQQLRRQLEKVGAA